MCRLRNIAIRDYQLDESVTTGQTDTRTDGQTVIPIFRYALPMTQKVDLTDCSLFQFFQLLMRRLETLFMGKTKP